MFNKTLSVLVVSIALTSPIWAQYEADDVVIDINAGEITVSADDFYRHLEGASASDAKDSGVDLSSFEAAIAFSEDIVKARTLVAEAKKQGYPDEDATYKIRRMINNQLKDAATESIKASIEAPEEKVEEFYAGMDTNLKVAIIMFESEDASRRVYDELTAGADFGDLAAENNVTEQLQKDRGELPQPINYHFDPAVTAVYELDAPGDFTEPMELPGGNWLIVKLIERVDAFSEENPKPDMETARAMIESQYVNFALNDFIEETLGADLAQVEVWRDEDLYQKGLSWHKNDVIEELYGNKLLLARVGDVELIFDDWWLFTRFLNMADEEWESRRNNPDGDQIVKDLESRYDEKLNDIRLVVWTELKGADKDGDVVWDIWRKSSEMTLDNYTEMELLPLIPHPSDEEVRAYFDEREGEYFEKESLSGRLYVFPTAEEANEYRAIADDHIPENNLAPDMLIKKILEDYGINPGEPESDDSSPEIGDFYITYRASREPEIERTFAPEISDELADSILEIAYEAETDVYSPVSQLSDGRYAFFWNRYYKPFRMKDFGEVKDSIYRILDEELVEATGTTTIINNWIEDIVAKYSYEINEDTARAVYDKWQADNTTE